MGAESRKTVPLTPEQTKRAFLASIPRMRDEFAHRFAQFRERIFHENDYIRKYPMEVLRLASEEMRLRHKVAQERIQRLLESGWRPSNSTEIRSVYGDCFGHSDFREDPFSDLYGAVRNAYRDIGQPDPQATTSPEFRLGEVNVQAYNEAVLDLETRNVSQNNIEDPTQAFRKRVLTAVDDCFHRTGAKAIQINDVAQSLKMPTGRETLLEVGRALRYWISRGAIDGDHVTTLDDGSPLMVIRGLTGVGYDILENRPTVGPQTVVNAENVGVVGSMSGGVVNQTVGATFADLVTALEKVRELAAETDGDAAALVESAVAGALGELRSPQPNQNKVRRTLTGIGQAIQTLGELGPAWTLVAAEAARFGWSIPLPPGIGH